MAASDIKDRFRNISGLSTSQFSDSEVTDDAEPVALKRYNHIMNDTQEISDHTTGDALIDEILACFVASYAFRDLFRKRVINDATRYKLFDQDAYAYMLEINKDNIGYNPETDMYYPNTKRRGNPHYTSEVSTANDW